MKAASLARKELAMRSKSFVRRINRKSAVYEANFAMECEIVEKKNVTDLVKTKTVSEVEEHLEKGKSYSAKKLTYNTFAFIIKTQYHGPISTLLPPCFDQ